MTGTFGLCTKPSCAPPADDPGFAIARGGKAAYVDGIMIDLIKKTGVSDQNFVFFKDESDFMQKAAKTPRSNCVMDSAKLAAAGIHLTPVHEAVERALKNWKKAV